jgi:glycosyltransferase involved in cell wall biosynthesis
MTRLLTIGIPTYNRSGSLRIMLECLSEQIKSSEKDIEIIISDNCSSDETSDVILEWVKHQCVDLKVTSVRQSSNIGLSRNLIFLLYASTSRYFMFLGDDDQLNSKSSERILKLLKEKKPSAIIQGAWVNKKRSKIGSIGFDDSLYFFYEYGNAWASVIDRDAAVKAVESRSIRNEIEMIVWPQTVFGYLAIYDLFLLRNVEVIDFEIGRPLTKSLNITTKSYWIRSLSDILMAAELIQKETKSNLIRKYFLGVKSSGFIGHVKAIIWNSLVDNDRSTLNGVRKQLRDNFGYRGHMWALLLLIDDYPVLIRFFVYIAFKFMNGNSNINFNSKINEARLKRNTDLLTNRNSGKRFGDWF